MRVSNSKVKTYRRCPKKYEFKYVMGLKPRAKTVQLERGSWIHDLLMHHYDGEDWKARHKELTKEFYSLFEEEREELGDLPTECARIMRAYLRYYKREDERYRVVDSELDEIITLPNGLELNIIIDLIVEDIVDGGLWIWDHKTRKSFGDSDSMDLDPQLTLYHWGVEYMGYTPLRGAVYNELRTKAPTIPQMTQKGHLSRRMDVDTTPEVYMAAIRKHGLNAADYSAILLHLAKQKDKFFRRTKIPKDPPMVKTMMKELVQSAQQIQADEAKSRFPRTFDQSCRWQCEYKDLCLTQLHGADIDSLIKVNFQRRKREED